MLLLAQNMNATWRSEVGSEFQSAANTSWLRNITSYAQGKHGSAHATLLITPIMRTVHYTAGRGVEVGVYELLINARSSTAFDQCAPNNAGSLPNSGYDCMDPTTRRTCTNNDQASCTGGPGCCSMCGASEFYDSMEQSVLDFWAATGITGVEQDGAESWQVRFC